MRRHTLLGNRRESFPIFTHTESPIVGWGLALRHLERAPTTTSAFTVISSTPVHQLLGKVGVIQLRRRETCDPATDDQHFRAHVTGQCPPGGACGMTLTSKMQHS